MTQPRGLTRGRNSGLSLRNPRTISVLGAIALSVAALTSCSGGASDAPTSAVSSPATAPTSTAPTSDTTVGPAFNPQETYFFISSAYNDVHSDAVAQFALPDGSIDADHAVEFCAALAPANERFAADIQAALWPDDAQDEAAALAQAVAGDAGALYSCAKAPSGDVAAETMSAHDWNASLNAARALRLALGLPGES